MSIFLLTLSSRSILHHDTTHCPVIVNENKWLKELITDAHCWLIIKKFPNCTACLETRCCQAVHKVNNFSQFQTASAVRHADSLAKFVCASQPAVHQSP
jgi:hypothetical protein